MFNIDKILKKKTEEFNKQKAKNVRYYTKHKYSFERIDRIKNEKFEFAIPYRPRLGIFKLKRRSLVTFDPNTNEAHSYSHWCFVKKIKGKIVLNDYSYSVTTRRHISMAQSLLEELGIKVDVTVNQNEDLDNGIQLTPLYRSIIRWEIAAARKGARKTTKHNAFYSIKSLNKEIVALKKLGGSITKDKIRSIKLQELENEKYRLEEVKRKREAWKLANADMLKKKAYHRDFDKLINSKDVQ